MENEKVLEMIKMRMGGETLQYIADKFGVSRECVRNWMPNSLADAKGLKRSCGNVVYPGIQLWMIRNKTNKTMLAEKLEMNVSGLTRILSGVSDVKKSHIDKILEVTGMSYEEAFHSKEEGEFD